MQGTVHFNRPILELYTLNLPIHRCKVAIGLHSIRGNTDKSKAEKMNIPISIPTFISFNASCYSKETLAGF